MSIFPGIERACLLIATDNGGLHRDRGIAQWTDEFNRWIWKRAKRQNLQQINDWLASLSDEKLYVVCCEEHSIAEREIILAPKGADTLLNDFFDEIC